MDSLDIESEECTEEQQTLLRDLISKFPDVFSQHDNDIGHYVGVEHQINLSNEVPFKHRHRRIPPGMFDEVREHLKQLASAGIIRRSHSPWSSAVVLARKKDGKLRMCVDYRLLINALSRMRMRYLVSMRCLIRLPAPNTIQFSI